MYKKWMPAALLTALIAVPAVPHSAHAAAAGEAADCSYGLKFRLGSAVADSDGQAVQLPAAPYLDHDNMMAPLRVLAEGLRAELTWHEETDEITIASGQRWIRLKLGSDAGAANGGEIRLPAPVTLVGERAYGPVRAVAEAIGGAIAWDEPTNTAAVSLSHCDRPVELSYTFKRDAEGWTGGFADLPVDYDQAAYDLKYDWSPVPLTEKKKVNGLLFRGMNRSDDLFMFAAKKIGAAEGLQPNTDYRVKLSFELATSESAGMVGIGGAPGEAVTVKAGVVNRQPQAVKKDDGGTPYYRMNIDTGSQTQGGADMRALGNLAKPESDVDGYQLKPFETELAVRSNENGELWVIVGTDSGYEGLTQIYFTDIALTLDKAAN